MFEPILFAEIAKIYGYTPIEYAGSQQLGAAGIYIEYVDISVQVNSERSITFDVEFDASFVTTRINKEYGWLTFKLHEHKDVNSQCPITQHDKSEFSVWRGGDTVTIAKRMHFNATIPYNETRETIKQINIRDKADE